MQTSGASIQISYLNLFGAAIQISYLNLLGAKKTALILIINHYYYN
jgi:hypothetical protein